MDIEQLTLILDAARAAGDGAMQVVFVWFAYKFVSLAALCGLVAGGLYGAYRLIKRAIDSNAFLEQISNVTGLDFYYHSNREKLMRWIRKDWKPNDL